MDEKTIYSNEHAKFSVEEPAYFIEKRLKEHGIRPSQSNALWCLSTLEWLRFDGNEEIDVDIRLKEGTTREEADRLCELLNKHILSLDIIG
jgi:hypothetical protein